MTLFTMISSANNGMVFANLGHIYDMPEEKISDLISHLLRPIMSGIARAASNADGLVSLLRILGAGRHTRLFDDAESFYDPAVRDEGLVILKMLLGSDFARHQVALRTSRDKQVSLEIVEHMLPYVAALSISALHHKTRSPLLKLLSKVLPKGQDSYFDRNPFKPLANFVAEGGAQPMVSGPAHRSLRSMLGTLFVRG